MAGAVIGLLLALAGSARADFVVTYNSGFQNGVVIPDGDRSGWSDTRIVSGAGGSIVGLSVTLNLSGDCNGDLYAYLVHDAGFTVLLNRVGRSAANPTGYGDGGMNVTLTAGGSDIHNYENGDYTLTAGQLTGIWSPDGRHIIPESAAGIFNTADRTALLSSFTGLNPNGIWTLYVADVNGGDQSTVTSWGLDIDVASVPEPGSMVEGALAALFLGGAIGLYRLKGPKPASA